jgi:hypothetical protein
MNREAAAAKFGDQPVRHGAELGFALLGEGEAALQTIGSISMELTDDVFDLALISRRQLDESQPATVTAKLATLSTHRSAKKAANFPPFDFGARFLCYAEWKAWSGQMSGDDFLDGLRAA